MAYAKSSIAYIERGTLCIKKHKQSEWILLFVLLWPFLINLVASLPGPLSYAQYVCDVIILCWCVGDIAGLSKSNTKVRREILAFVLWICVFLAYTLVTYARSYQSALYYLWGIRSNFRCYILFFHVLLHMTQGNVDEWLNLLDPLFWINAVLSVIQFVFGGVKQDMLGGIFGVEAGTNGFTLVFLSIVVVKSQLKLYEQEEKVWVCLLKCAAALLIAAMAELKFYLLLFVFQMVLVSILTKFSWKKALVLSFCAIAVSFSMDLLAQWFSESKIFDIATLVEKAFQKNYATANDLNRLSAINTLSQDILTDPVDRVFGLGLGNCDSANFSFLRTPFYEMYSYLHYRWFSAPMMFLETGYLGLALYLGFFVICFIKTLKKRKHATGNAFYTSMAIVFSITAPILAFYNASLRYESGWMIYTVLALPFVASKQDLAEG